MIELEYCDISVLNKPSKSFYMLKNTVFLLKIQISGKLFSNFKFSKNNIGLKDAPRCKFSSPKTISHISTSFSGILEFFEKMTFFSKLKCWSYCTFNAQNRPISGRFSKMNFTIFESSIWRYFSIYWSNRLHRQITK